MDRAAADGVDSLTRAGGRAGAEQPDSDGAGTAVSYHSPRLMQQADLVGALVATAGYVSLGAAVMAGKTSDVDHALRRSQRHRAQGPRRAFGEGVKLAARPEVQLVSATVIAIAMHRAGVKGARAVIGATVSAYVADRLTKYVVHRRRPPGYHTCRCAARLRGKQLRVGGGRSDAPVGCDAPVQKPWAGKGSRSCVVTGELVCAARAVM